MLPAEGVKGGLFATQLLLGAAIWVRITTTNAIERLLQKLRKRIRPMCAFINNARCERIVHALFNVCNQKWRKTPMGQYQI